MLPIVVRGQFLLRSSVGHNPLIISPGSLKQATLTETAARAGHTDRRGCAEEAADEAEYADTTPASRSLDFFLLFELRAQCGARCLPERRFQKNIPPRQGELYAVGNDPHLSASSAPCPRNPFRRCGQPERQLRDAHRSPAGTPRIIFRTGKTRSPQPTAAIKSESDV